MRHLIFLPIVLFALNAVAAEQAVTIAAPKCNAASLREKAGEGVTKIKAAEWKDGYIVTFEDTKTSAVELTKKLHQAGCF